MTGASAEDPHAYWAILNLIHQYADALDRGDFDAIGVLFHYADIYMPGNEAPVVRAESGQFGDLLRAAVRVYLPAGTPRTRHVTTNHQIHFEDPATARTRSYFTVFQEVAPVRLEPIITGIYDDRLVRVATGWRFTERREAITSVGDLSAHLIGDINIVRDN